MIEICVDAYGHKARASCVADFLELIAALTPPAPSKSTLADWLRDNDYDDLSPEPYVDNTPGSDQEKAQDAAESVFSVLAQRQRILGGAYPFVTDGHTLTVAGGTLPVPNNAYVRLLGLTTAHAYSLGGVTGLSEAFEKIVADALCALGLASLSIRHMGPIKRSPKGFTGRMREVQEKLGLAVGGIGGVTSKKPFDQKGDVVGHLSWKDRRLGAWVVVGQATCAKSTAWEAKLSELHARRWRKYLGLRVDPLAFLAVPHHVGDSVLLNLLDSEESIVVDRLRLAAVLTDPTQVPVAAWDAVATAGVATLQSR